MGYIEKVSDKIAKIIIKEGLDYNQTKAVFKVARTKAGLKPAKKVKGAVERLSLEEELAFINQAYEESGRIGLMMQTLLETGCRVSEFIELRIVHKRTHRICLPLLSISKFALFLMLLAKFVQKKQAITSLKKQSIEK